MCENLALKNREICDMMTARIAKSLEGKNDIINQADVNSIVVWHPWNLRFYYVAPVRNNQQSGDTFGFKLLHDRCFNGKW